MKTWLTLLILMTLAAGPGGAIPGGVIPGGVTLATADDGVFTRDLDAFIEDAMKRVPALPGLAIGIVRDGKVIYRKGFGYRNVEEKLPATPNTAFYLASGTKGLTGMTAAVLATRGELDLGAPVSQFLPEMKLPAPFDPGAITLKNLLTHTSGIGNRDAMFYLAYKGELPREQFMQVLASDKTQAIPTSFIYTNLGYNIFGYVLEAKYDESWRTIVKRTVLDPAGMTRTTASMSEAEADEIAYGYRMDGDAYTRLDLKTDGMMHAAGGHVSTVDDMCRWLTANMNGGVLDGRQVLPAAAVALAHERLADTDRDFYLFHREAYGLGIYHATMGEERMMHHFGGYEGFHAHTSFLPEHGIGIAAFANTNDYSAGTVTHVVAAYAYSLLLGDAEAAEGYKGELDKLVLRVDGQKHYDDGLRAVTAAIDAGTEENAVRLIQDVLADLDKAGFADESAVNRLGYGYLGDEHFDLAIAVLEFAAKKYDENPNSFDSLGEACELAGRVDDARANYAKAVALGKESGDDNLELYQKNLARVSAQAN